MPPQKKQKIVSTTDSRLGAGAGPENANSEHEDNNGGAPSSVFDERAPVSSKKRVLAENGKYVLKPSCPIRPFPAGQCLCPCAERMPGPANVTISNKPSRRRRIAWFNTEDQKSLLALAQQRKATMTRGEGAMSGNATMTRGEGAMSENEKMTRGEGAMSENEKVTLGYDGAMSGKATVTRGEGAMSGNEKMTVDRDGAAMSENEKVTLREAMPYVYRTPMKVHGRATPRFSGKAPSGYSPLPGYAGGKRKTKKTKSKKRGTHRRR